VPVKIKLNILNIYSCIYYSYSLSLTLTFACLGLISPTSIKLIDGQSVNVVIGSFWSKTKAIG